MSVFQYPKIYLFPPLYTKQPNTTILQHQLEQWCRIILDYCEHYSVTLLTAEGIPKHSQTIEDCESLPPIFHNKDIERSVNNDLRALILNHLITKEKKAEYINPKSHDTGLFIYWRTPTEWAELLYDYVKSTGQTGTILTIYELTNSQESGLPETLKNMGEPLLIKILKDVLVKQGKAQLLINEDGEIGGVKIV